MHFSVIRSNVLDAGRLMSCSGWVESLSVRKQELTQHRELEFDCTESTALLLKIEHFKCKTVAVEKEHAWLWHMLSVQMYILNKY